MVYPVHYLLQFGGPLHDVEVWSCGVRLSAVTAGGLDDPNDFAAAQLADVVTNVQSYISSWAASSAAKLEFVKFNAIGPDGRYTDKTRTIEQHFTGTLQSSGGTVQNAPQVALCMTHTTPVLRGPACRGRMFIPSPRYAVTGPDGLISTANAQSAADAHAAFLIALDDASGTDPFEGGECVVVSNVGEGVVHKITGVKVGRVLDTIRTRRNKLVEDYVVSAAVVG